MGKKKQAEKKPVGTETEDGRVRMAFRFEPSIAKRLEELAEKTGVSLNQLMNGMAQLFCDKARPGKEPFRSDESPELILEREQDGIIWLGQPTKYFHTYMNEYGEQITPYNALGEFDESFCHRGSYKVISTEIKHPGIIIGVLDFTVRRVVREE